MDHAYVPEMQRLIDDGTVWFDDDEGEWLGAASDGEVVSFGPDDDGAARYLVGRPSPCDW